jgi:lysophospholipase L1-like esterase
MGISERLGRECRALACWVLVGWTAGLSGCLFQIEHLVPDHANVGDRIVLRNPYGTEPLQSPLSVLFANVMIESIVRQSAQEIVVEIPAGLEGKVAVSVWLSSLPVSNIADFQVDSQPILHRIIAYGDSLVGPWAYHPQILDGMLNQSVGPSLVINEGKAGETVSEGARRLEEVLSTHIGVRFLYFLEGANDVSDSRNSPIPAMLSALDDMVDLAAAYAVRPILVTLPPKTRHALLIDRVPPTTEDWNHALREYALFNGIDWIDLHQAFVSRPDWESLLLEDGLHLSPEGQVFVAETVYSGLTLLLE